MMKTTRRVLLAAGAAALALPALLASPAQAITPAEIKARGKIIVGIQGDNPPWGFVTSAGKQDGLDADIATLFAKELGVQVEFVPLEVNNRIPALTTGRVDVLFATMAMLPERAKAVQFSKPYVANTIVLVGAKKDTIKTNEDMGKFTIGVAKGAAQDTQVTKNAPSGTTIRRYDGDAPSIQALVSARSRRWAATSSTCSASSRRGPASSRTSSSSRTSTTAPAPASARRRSTPRSTASSTRSRPMASCRRSTTSG